MRKIVYIFFSLLLMLTYQSSSAQTASLSGTIGSAGAPLAFGNVILKGTQIGGSANEDGKFVVDQIPPGTYAVQISSVGYVASLDSITFGEGEHVRREFELKEDMLSLSQVVITGTRNAVERYNSPVIVNRIDPRIFESNQSLNVVDGLNFSPGLRVENNCQNCGFTQLRMNGLDGAYSQILINSRPVFSALAGVYGLEMLPANMIDRIEVVRGGGSVMYGGNAIAGTVNIITKDPIENSFEVGVNQSLINGQASDRTVNFNGAIVSEDLDKGISLFGFNRNRDYWDANGDGFSEVVKLRNNTFGFDAFYNLSEFDRIELSTYCINEFRRGGNKFDLLPHQTDVTEQLEHDIVSANASYERRSKDNKHKYSLYGSLQHVTRSSYYGGGGRVIVDGDSLTPQVILALNAYGNSKDISTVTGIQYNVALHPVLTLLVGSEYIYNDVIDEMPGYARLIDQRVGTWGSFAELEVKPIEKLTLLAGGRFDQLRINGRYILDENSFDNGQDLNVFVPRASAMYAVSENIKLRASFAQGYRGPQAFDEDLHLETVGGTVRFVELSPNLEVERSNSAVFSLNYDRYVGDNQMNVVVEGFYTQLSNPFIFADQRELPSGVAVITKRNGDGATVSGMNLEANVAFGSKLIVQSGATLQRALYDVEELIWAPEDASDAELPSTTTNRLLRTPDAYGYFSALYNPIERLSIAYSGVITGSMLVPHVIDVDNERTILETTPWFFENNIKLSYAFRSDKHYELELFGGVQNILNSYQEDFDLGSERDAGYIYGPIRPRTYFMGLKFGLN